jgi:hypothetical protein
MKKIVYVYKVFKECIRLHFVMGTIGIIFLFTGCVSNYPKVVMDPPWVPETEVSGGEEIVQPDLNIPVPVYFNAEDRPVIDGTFDEWQGLDGPVTRMAVLGGSHNPEDGEAFFVLRTDGINLFVYARATDDVIHENNLPGSLAWRGDTVEFFFGSLTTKHQSYAMGDNQIRLVPRSKTDTFNVDVVVNQKTINVPTMSGEGSGPYFKAAAHFEENSYEIEASIPLDIIMIDGLKVGQKVRCDFQINDADETERDRMIHWMSTGDTPWNDPSVWGNGLVVELPVERKEAVNEL